MTVLCRRTLNILLTVGALGVGAFFRAGVLLGLPLSSSIELEDTSISFSEMTLLSQSLNAVDRDQSELSSDLEDAPDYKCIQRSGQFLTIARTPRGMIPLIIWQSEAFGSAWTPEVRCRAVSTRFQAFASQNLLKYISTGKLNNYPIICVSEEYGDCLSNGLLLTLEPQDNPNQVLKDLFDLGDSITRSTTNPVIDLEYILEEKKVLDLEGIDDADVSDSAN